MGTRNDTPIIGGLFALEIPVTDITRSQKFYSDLFGWQFEGIMPRGSDGVQALHFFKNAAQSITGALVLLEQGHTPKSAGVDSWGLWPTLVVANVSEALKQVEAQAGSVKTPRLELPSGMGVVAHVLDPDGNVLGIWSQV
ncbi:hypothetical protein NLG97_g615 [Lecanicillium saksenae]|uniref:Uncharacterized protein n=1 Tax=Lecanicillium saksenae TaxID=468837 RepID=A0ACC1R6B7_9HYPO|nr:hypothetical protein NLG97_g615 [Lecanicillium saksenae]